MAVKWYLEYGNHDVLIIVPTTSLVEQMYSDFAEYSSQDESFNNDELCYKNFGPYTNGFELIEYNNLNVLENKLKNKNF